MQSITNWCDTSLLLEFMFMIVVIVYIFVFFYVNCCFLWWLLSFVSLGQDNDSHTDRFGRKSRIYRKNSTNTCGCRLYPVDNFTAQLQDATRLIATDCHKAVLLRWFLVVQVHIYSWMCFNQSEESRKPIIHVVVSKDSDPVLWKKTSIFVDQIEVSNSISELLG